MLALIALVVSALAVPVPAIAGSLLSGYGGPGQGSQAILGSQLLNGPAGGGGSDGAGSSSSTQDAGNTASTGAEVGTRTSPGTARKSATGKPTAGKQSKGTTGRSQSRRGSLSGAHAPVRVAQSADVSSPTLGLSGADLLYVLIAFGALACTAVLTRRFARPPG